MGEHEGRRFFNDSKSTTPRATTLAVEAFGDPRRIHLIAGGYDKGLDLAGIAAIAGRLAGLYTIGATGRRLAAAAPRGRCVERLEAALKKPTNTHDLERRELDLLTRCRETLEAERPLSEVVATDEARKLVSSFAFMTQKPVICVRNVSDDGVRSQEPLAVPADRKGSDG